MGESFKKFKARARLHAAVSSFLIGIGLGTVFVSVFMLAAKLDGNDMRSFYYPIGVGISIVSAIILYLLFSPSDKRLAARLDSLYGLDEKVSTMVEFCDNPDGFYVLQREDAEQKLSDKPMKAMKSRTLLSSLITLVLSVCLLITAVVVPVKAEHEDPIDEFDKQWILASLDEIIVTLQSNRFMDEDLKEFAVGELRSLVAFVEENSLFSEMKAEAIRKIIGIDSELDATNTASAIGERFAASVDENLLNIADNLIALSGSGTKKAITDLGSALMNMDYDSIGFTAAEMNSYLASSGAPIDDDVYVVFKALTVEMQNGSMKDIEAAVELAARSITDAISIQNLNASSISKAISGVCELFGITESDLDAEGVEVVLPDKDAAEQSPVEDDETKEPDASMGSGGIGTGDVIYGSNDMIYDPYKNTYVPYGTLINDYFAKINEKITDGKVSDEDAKLFDSYFGMLMGSKNEDKEQ